MARTNDRRNSRVQRIALRGRWRGRPSDGARGQQTGRVGAGGSLRVGSGTDKKTAVIIQTRRLTQTRPGPRARANDDDDEYYIIRNGEATHAHATSEQLWICHRSGDDVFSRPSPRAVRYVRDNLFLVTTPLATAGQRRNTDDPLLSRMRREMTPTPIVVSFL